MTDQKQKQQQPRHGSGPGGSRSSAYAQSLAAAPSATATANATAAAGDDGDGDSDGDSNMTTLFSAIDGRSSDSMYSYDTAYTPTEGPLVCEFRDLLGCEWSFGAHDIEAWVAHVSAHFGGRFPAKSMCWFCNDFVFDSGDAKAKAKGGGGGSSKQQQARRLKFEDRLRHVAAHLPDGFRYHHMRPDYNVIRHLHKHSIISSDTFDQCMKYTELPETLLRMRLQGADKPASSPRTHARKTDRGRVEHDLAKEDRHRRRGERIV